MHGDLNYKINHQYTLYDIFQFNDWGLKYDLPHGHSKLELASVMNLVLQRVTDTSVLQFLQKISHNQQ
jgi:hypothetical protein